MARERESSQFTMSQSDDFADGLKSMSFGSFGRSDFETISTTSSDLSRSASAAADAFAKHLSSGGDAASYVDRIWRHRPAFAREPLLPRFDLHFVRRLGIDDIGNVHLAEIKCCSAEGKRIVIEGAATAECVVAVKVMDKEELAGQGEDGAGDHGDVGSPLPAAAIYTATPRMNCGRSWS